MAEHKDLPDAQLHEPKGVSSASINTVYVSDGAGSGTWKKVDLNSLNVTNIYNLNKSSLQGTFLDASTADTFVIPIVTARTLTKVTAVLTTGITTADTTLSIYNNTTLIGTLVIAYSGSTEGTTFTYNPASNNTFTAGSRLKVVSDGNSSGTARLELVFDFTLTG